MEPVRLRGSRINGCSACVYAGVANAEKAGESDERLHAVAAGTRLPSSLTPSAPRWREAATRLADHTGQAVSDAFWDEAADHFDEQQLAAIILMLATTNFFNRLNTIIQEPVGTAWS